MLECRRLGGVERWATSRAWTMIVGEERPWAWEEGLLVRRREMGENAWDLVPGQCLVGAELRAASFSVDSRISLSFLKQIIKYFILYGVKEMYDYIAQYPVHWAIHSDYFTLWQTCSFRHQILLLWEAFSHAAITYEDYSITFPPLFTARYSFIQLSEMGLRGEIHKKCSNDVIQYSYEWE